MRIEELKVVLHGSLKVFFVICMNLLKTRHYFAGFALATIIGFIPELGGSALILIAFVGIAIALNDFQTRVAIKKAACILS